MATTTTRRRQDRQQAADPTPTIPVVAATPTKEPVPAGAAKMQTWYIDTDGRRVRVPQPVPVDSDDQPTPHQLYRCPHKAPANGGGTRRCEITQWLLPDTVRFCPVHGDQLTAPVTPDPLRVLLREARRLHGRSAAPWALLATEVAAGIAIQTSDLPIATTGMLVPAAGVGAYLVTKRTLTRRAITRGRIERGQRTGRRVRQIHASARRAAYLGAVCGSWLPMAAAVDPGGWSGRLAWATLLGGWALGSYPWWGASDRRRDRIQAAKIEVDLRAIEQAAAEPQGPDPVQLWAITRWAALIGKSAGPLAGTHLEGFTRLPACALGGQRDRLPNWSAKVVANDPGSINMRETRPTLLGRIAAAYGCTYADVSFSADEGDLSIAWVRVQPDNVLAEARTWPGPDQSNDWKNGRSIIGRHDDGAPMRYQWWTKTGAIHDLISGCTGSGKSELVVQLILNSLHSNGLVIDWLSDPQGGQSYGAIKDHVDWFARDKTETTLMLLAAKKEMLRRNDALSAANIKTWRATLAMPLLVLTLDEIQTYIDDPIILQLVEDLATQGRKCGIKLRLVTQVPAVYNLGGSSTIKEQLKAGQTLIGRAATDVAGRLAVDGDCPVDPTMLPDKWGPATCNPGQTTAGLIYVQGIHGRDVFGRADFTGEDMTIWLVDEKGATNLSPGVFGSEAQTESGVLWGDRKARAALALAAGRNDEDLLPGGKALELIELAAVTATTGPLLRLAPNPPATTAKPTAKPTAREQVLAAARQVVNDQGLVERDAIIAATPGLKDDTRNKALTDLVADGQLRRIRNKIFELTKAA